MSEDLDALDRVCAEWMGFHYVKGRPSEGGWHLNANGSLAGMVMSPTPHPTRSWSDFGALLLALKDPMKYSPGLTMVVAPGPNYGKWCACLRFDCKDMVYHEDPRVALALAVEALCKGGVS